MKIEFTHTEIEYLAELLESCHRTKLHELHHTATRAYAQMLREKIELTENLRAKLEAVREVPV